MSLVETKGQWRQAAASHKSPETSMDMKLGPSRIHHRSLAIRRSRLSCTMHTHMFSATSSAWQLAARLVLYS